MKLCSKKYKTLNERKNNRDTADLPTYTHCVQQTHYCTETKLKSRNSQDIQARYRHGHKLVNSATRLCAEGKNLAENTCRKFMDFRNINYYLASRRQGKASPVFQCKYFASLYFPSFQSRYV